MAETLPGFEAIQWYALCLRANTPAISSKAEQEIDGATSDEKMQLDLLSLV